MDEQREAFDEKLAELFADWVADHRCDIEEELLEQYYWEYPEEDADKTTEEQ